MAKNQQAAAPAVKRAEAELPSAGTCVVGLKMPHGLRLQLYEMVEDSEPVLGGGIRSFKRAVPVGDPIVLKGYAAYKGEDRPTLVVGGYAINRNVPADFMRRWLHENKDNPIVREGLIVVRERQDDVQGLSEDSAGKKNGLEPLDPANLPPALKGIMPADKKDKEFAAA